MLPHLHGYLAGIISADVSSGNAMGKSLSSLAASLRDVKHRVVWTEEEDRRLGELILKHGVNKWSVVASEIASKSNKHCRRRWQARLNAVGNKGMWTQEEDAKLLEGHRLFGNRWTDIAGLVPGRTDNAAKNRYMAISKKMVANTICNSSLSDAGPLSPTSSRNAASMAPQGLKRPCPECFREPPSSKKKAVADRALRVHVETRCFSGSEISEVVQKDEEWAESAHPQTPAARTWIDLNVPYTAHREP